MMEGRKGKNEGRQTGRKEENIPRKDGKEQRTERNTGRKDEKEGRTERKDGRKGRQAGRQAGRKEERPCLRGHVEDGKYVKHVVTEPRES